MSAPDGHGDGQGSSASSTETVGIVGAGRFGTALGQVVAQAGRRVLLWSRAEDVVRAINEERVNPRLPDLRLAPLLGATLEPEELARAARFLVVAVASTEVRERMRILGDSVDGRHVIVHAIGALASPGDVRVSEVILGETPALRVGVLAGPVLWRDLAAGRFASMVVASRFDEVTAEGRRLLGVPPTLRVYRGSDLVGAELASALSGAYTVAVGMSDELGLGPGPRAVLVTRALAEASRLGQAAGAEPRTFTGLTGLGSLLVRSSVESSESSLDYRLGRRLGRGEAVTEEDYTEGGRAALAGVRLAKRLGVRTPVLQGLAAVITGRLSPREAAHLAAEAVASEE